MYVVSKTSKVAMKFLSQKPICIIMYLCHCRLKASNVNLKVELYMNGDQIDPANDRKLVTQLGIRDKTVSELV